MVVNMVFLLRRLVGVVVEGFWAGVDMGVRYLFWLLRGK